MTGRTNQIRDYAESIGAGRLEWMSDDVLADRAWRTRPVEVPDLRRAVSSVVRAFREFGDALRKLGRIE